MKFEKLYKLLTEGVDDMAKKIDQLRNTDKLVQDFIDKVQVGSPMHDDAMAVVRNTIQAKEDGNDDIVRLGRMMMAAAVKHVKETKRKMDKAEFVKLMNDVNKKWKES